MGLFGTAGSPVPTLMYDVKLGKEDHGRPAVKTGSLVPILMYDVNMGKDTPDDLLPS
jgi:hypothetical protein